MPGLSPNAQGVYMGIQGVQSFLQNQQNRQDQKDSAEAQNVAMNFAQALDAAQNSPDEKTRAQAMQTLDLILKNKEYKKVLDKVYKGWLVKADQQQKAKSKQQQPDPETQGFEQGLQKYFQDKAAGGAQAQQAQLPQMPSQLQGYRMPTAGPAQMLANIKMQEEAKRAMSDPKVMLTSQLNSQEKAEIERGSTLGKIEMENKRWAAYAEKSHNDMLRSVADYRRAMADAQRAETAAKAGEKAAQSREEEARLRVQKAQVDLDIARQKAQAIHDKLQSGSKTPSNAFMLHRSRVNDALTALANIEKKPPSWYLAGPPDELRNLQSSLKLAGMGALAGIIPTKGFFPDVKGMLTEIRSGLEREQADIKDRGSVLYPNWDFETNSYRTEGEVPDTETPEPAPAAGGGGDLPPGFGGSTAPTTPSTSGEPSEDLPPGFEEPPETP
jgi:hypothetical protein